jgi:Na+-driven multidrug efflux pump
LYERYCAVFSTKAFGNEPGLRDIYKKGCFEEFIIGNSQCPGRLWERFWYWRGPFVFRIVYRGVYEGSAPVLRILLIAAVLAIYNIFYETVFNALKKYRVIQTVNVLHALLNLILDFILIPVIGVATAAVISYAVRVVISETYFRTKIKPNLKISE